MKPVHISYIVIGLFILAFVCYQFFGSDYVNVLHALVRSSLSPYNYTNSIQCRIDDTSLKMAPQLPDALLHHQLDQPLLFPFPKVAYYHSNRAVDVNGGARQFYLSFSPEYTVNINSNSNSFDSRLSDIGLDRFCSQSRSYSSINSSDVELFIIDEINVSITDLKIHPDLVYPELLSRQSGYKRHLSELLLDDSLVIQHENDEFYELSISPGVALTEGTVKIQCNTEKGLLLALSTLRQLVASPLPLQLPLTIIDWPDNNWRGFLVDVSRHFTPVKLLKRTLDAMEASKLNILHFHLTDAQSFPLLLDDVTVPSSSSAAADAKGPSSTLLPLSQLARRSAFSSQKIYTKDDIRDLLQYAYERGVTVVPEIDMPAHAHSWSKAFDHILVNCSSVARRSQTPLNIYPLDPSQPLTWVLVEQILTQVVDLFDQSPYLHVGGDEVDEACWAESPRVVQWAQERGIPLREVTKYFEQEVFKVVYRLGRVPMVWQGILDGNQMPPPSSYLPGWEKVVQNRTAAGAVSPTASHGFSSGGVAHTVTKSEVKDKYTKNATLTHITNSSQSDASVQRAANSRVVKAVNGTGKVSSIASGKTNIATTNSTKSAAGPVSKNQTNNASSGHSKRRLVASEPFAPPVVEPWKCWDGLAIRSGVTAVQSGHPMLMSACYYLDYNQDWSTYLAADLTTTSRAFAGSPSDAGNGTSGDALTAQRFSYSPRGGLHQLTPEEVVAVGPVSPQDMFMGGEATMFAELIDLTNFECRLHPRLGAVAARLWGLGSQFISVAYTDKHSLTSPPSGSGSLRKKPVAGRLVANPGHQNMQLTVDQSRLLYMSFIRYRFFLVNELNVKASPLVFHYSKPSPVATKSSNSNTSKPFNSYVPPPTVDLYPVQMDDEIEALRRAIALSQPMLLSTNDRSYNQIKEGTFRITAQCRGMPEPIQRPLTTKIISFAQINICNGASSSSSGSGSSTTSSATSRLAILSAVPRSTKLADWLTKNANGGTLFIGFNELNGWEELYSRTELMKNKPKIVLTAAASGYTYSHVMSSTSHPYSLGLVSALPFTVIKEYTTPSFSRGLLHTYFASLDVHVMVLHLSPKSAATRLQEVTQILEIVKPLLESNSKVVLMGDFNTLSPYDRRQHDSEELTTLFKRTDHETFRHFGNKYLDSKKNGIDYTPMEKLLSDICVERCIASAVPGVKTTPVYNSVVDKINAHQWQINLTTSISVGTHSAYEQCMRRSCPFTEPTQYNPEWPFKDASHPRIRVDFILVSSALLKPVVDSPESTSGDSLVEYGGVDITDLTKGMSDHYPVFAGLRDAQGREFDLFRRT